MSFYHNLAQKIPDLRSRLRQARINDEPADYLKKILFNSLLLAVGLSIVAFFFLHSPLALLTIPIFFPALVMYFLNYADMKAKKINSMMDQEIVFAGRFIVVGLDSGVPIHKIFEDVERNYPVTGYYFGEILNKMYLGTAMEDAINETLVDCPSPKLRKILWQILNSMKTGTEVGTALNSVIDQIVKEQDIAVKEYGKKLNPMAMFYMMISLVLPSLGITMLVILATFMGLQLGNTFFILLAIFIGFIQFMFLMMIKSSRPAISA